MLGQVLGKSTDRGGLPVLGVGRQGQVVVPAPIGRFVDGNGVHVGQVGLGDRHFDVTRTDRVHPVPGFADHPRHCGKGHLLAHRQHQRLEQQREARQLARPGRLHQNHPAIRQLHPRRPHLQIALVLEEVQMPVALDLRVVRRVQAGRLRMHESAARHEVDADRQGLLCRMEIDPLDKPGIGNAEGGFKQLVVHGRAMVSKAECRILPHSALDECIGLKSASRVPPPGCARP